METNIQIIVCLRCKKFIENEEKEWEKNGHKNQDFLKIPQEISKDYDLISIFAAEEFKAVFHAKKKSNHEEYMIKLIIIGKNLTNSDEENYVSFVEKIKKACLMSHPNLIKCFAYFDFLKTSKMIGILMELMKDSLENKIKKDITEKDVIQYLFGICEGIRYLYEEQKMIHGELNPSNIFIKEMNVKMCAFEGFQKKNSLNKEYELKYIAPEHNKEIAEISNKVDIWSLGIITRELLSSFSKKNKNVSEKKTILEDSYCATTWTELIEGCIKLDPSQRLDIKSLKNKIDEISMHVESTGERYWHIEKFDQNFQKEIGIIDEKVSVNEIRDKIKEYIKKFDIDVILLNAEELQQNEKLMCAVIEVITSCRITFNINFLKLSDYNLEKTFNAIKTNTLTCELGFFDQNIGVDKKKMELLADVLKNNTTISNLFLSKNLLGADIEILTILIDSLKANDFITKLSFSENQLGENIECMQLLAALINFNKNITTLILNNNKLNVNIENMKLLRDSLTNNTTITVLFLDFNHLGLKKENVIFLADIIKNNKTITELSLFTNSLANIDDFYEASEKQCNYIEILADSLKVNSSIERINLAQNQLGFHIDNIKFLIHALNSNKNIASLDLSLNHLGRNIENILLLSDFLRGNFNITELNLSSNYLEWNIEYIQLLTESLKNNNAIKKLYLGNNDLGNNIENMKLIADLFKNNKSITNLDISYNELNANIENIKLLTDILENNNTVTELDLRMNELGRNIENMRLLTDFMKTNVSITQIDLSNNLLEENSDNAKLIADLLKVNTKIKNINLLCNGFEKNIQSLKLLKETNRMNNITIEF